MMEGEGYCTGEEESDSVASIRPSSSHKIGKKKRFSDVQIRSLEKIFENETTRLEPWKKVQLARELGLHPRQIAIWFQNRRARWKTKRVEKDYGLLQADYDALLASFESLKQEKQALLEQAHLADFESLSQRSPPEHKPVAGMHEQDACSCEIEKLSRLLEKQPQPDSGKKRAWCENSVDGCSENGDRKPDCQKDMMVAREGEPDMRSSLLSDSGCSKAMGKVRKDVDDQGHQDGVAEEINGYTCGPFCFPGRSYGLESSVCCYPDQTWQWPWELWP